MKKLIPEAILKYLAGLMIISLLLFIPAGTIVYPGAWRFLILLFIPVLVMGIVLYVKAPQLLAERLNAREPERDQETVLALSVIEFVVCFIIAAFDFRFGWTHFPIWLTIIFCTGFLGAYGLFAEVLRENSFLSRTVKVHEGQIVVSTGLYGIVRHPMYFSSLLLFWLMPLVLGSLPAFFVMLPFPLLLVRRIISEERILEAGLPGYPEYMEKVRFRLIPFIW